MTQKTLLTPVFLLAALLGTSCGTKRAHKPLYPVRGQVLYEGRPANRALVVLHPLSDPSPETGRPRGQVGEDGSFTLSTYGTKDGAPAGDYRVTVELWLSSGKGDEGPTSRLPAKYAKPEKSGLTATVDAGPTELKPFQLKR